MNKSLLILMIPLLFFTHLSVGQTGNEKLLLIGLDGVKPEVLKVANTPNLDALMQLGTFSYEAFTDYPTTTFPGFASMVTGVWNDKHRVLSTNVNYNQFDTYPGFLKRMEQHDNSLITVILTRPPFAPLYDHMNDHVDSIFYIQHDHNIRSYTVAVLNNFDADVIFTYFVEADHAGHAFGYSPLVSEYVDAIELLDSYVGDILAAVVDRPNYSTEDWLILVSTDHGGLGQDHGGPFLEERNIFFIAAGDSVPQLEVKRDSSEIVIDSAIVFNGVDQIATIPNDPAYAFGSGKDFTIECWVKPAPSNHMSIMLSNQTVGNLNSKGFTMAYNLQNSKTWLVHMADGSRNSTFYGQPLSDGAMQHIAFSVNRDELITLYQDGVNINSGFIGNIQNITSPRNISIGQDGLASFVNSFGGSIKELRIWNGVVSEEAVAQYACQPLDTTHPFISNLIGYWKMDEIVSDAFEDLSITQNDANLSDDNMMIQAVNYNMKCIDYSQTPRIVDVAYTALDHFCIPIQPSWGLDGRSWLTKYCGLSTCTDGIQNGNETGVDCGGSCTPCLAACPYVTIDDNDFESGWGIWNDGGTDCRRSSSDAQYAIGNFCVRLRDNTSSSVMVTDNLDLSAFNEITVDFSYITSSMDNSGEDFWLQLSTDGGGSYLIYEEWNTNDEFVNNVRYFDQVVIPGPFTTSTKLRFRCDASSDADYVYIDEVVITGCVLSNKRQSMTNQPIESEVDPAKNNSLDEINLFPNPNLGKYQVDIGILDHPGQLQVYDLSGNKILEFGVHANSAQTIYVDMNRYDPGAYLIRLIVGGRQVVKRVVIQ